MRITENVHLIRKEFQVTPVINRYVNVYLIEGQHGCYLIDSGVSGTERLIDDYMRSIGKSIQDIKGLFLTHSHPDHIGAANEIKKLSDCIVYVVWNKTRGLYEFEANDLNDLGCLVSEHSFWGSQLSAFCHTL